MYTQPGWNHIGGRVKSALIVLAALGCWPLSSFGLGSRIPNQDAAAIGRGNAFVATADNPSAIYYNPAGITQQEGHNLLFGSLFYLNIYADYRSPDGEELENDTKILPVPELHYVFAPKEIPVAFGLGIYSPFGLGMEWPDDAPFRSGGLKAELMYATINPVVAFKPLPTLSLAIGPTFNYSDAELVQGQPLPGYRLKFHGDDWAYGFNAGVMWQPHRKWSFGAKYFAATEMNYEGKASFSPSAPFLPPATDTTTHLQFPQIVSGGVSFRPTTNWNFEVAIDWSDWNQVDSAKIDGVGQLPLHWESSFFYHFGVTRYVGKGFYLSAGYFFSEASTPEKQYTPLVPDTDLHVGSLGVIYKTGKWSCALAGQLIGGDWREIDNANNATVNGEYKLFTPTVSFNVGYHF